MKYEGGFNLPGQWNQASEQIPGINYHRSSDTVPKKCGRALKKLQKGRAGLVLLIELHFRAITLITPNGAKAVTAAAIRFGMIDSFQSRADNQWNSGQSTDRYQSNAGCVPNGPFYFVRY